MTGAVAVAVVIVMVLAAEACYYLGRARGLREALDIVLEFARRRDP